MNSPRTPYRRYLDTSSEAEQSVLAAVYRFVLFDSQARRGAQYDLTNDSTAELAKKRNTKHGK